MFHSKFLIEKLQENQIAGKSLPSVDTVDRGKKQLPIWKKKDFNLLRSNKVIIGKNNHISIKILLI